MRNPNRHAPGRGHSGAIGDDAMMLVLIAVGAIGLGIVNFGGIRTAAVQWLLEHDVLAAPAVAIVMMPGGQAGLDLPRIAVLAGLFLAAAGLLWRRRTSQSKSNRAAALRP